jgi:hypothetical protein
LFSGADDTLVLSIEAVGSPPLRRPKKRGPFQLVPVMARATPTPPGRRAESKTPMANCGAGLPRQIDIDQVSDAEIQDIVLTANLTPRKCLGFKTPFQAILKELGKDVQIRFS